jgi:hypothetical protein
VRCRAAAWVRRAGELALVDSTREQIARRWGKGVGAPGARCELPSFAAEVLTAFAGAYGVRAAGEIRSSWCYPRRVRFYYFCRILLFLFLLIFIASL